MEKHIAEMPKVDDFFWYINRFGNPALEQWTGHSYHLMLYKLGNCYRTEADAKKDRDKWADFYASDEVISVFTDDIVYSGCCEDDADCWCE